MSFYDRLSQTAGAKGQEVHKYGKDKVDSDRLHSMISEEEKQIDRLCLDIGKEYLNLYDGNYHEKLREKAGLVHDARDRIEAYRRQLLVLSNSVVCKNCGSRISKKSTFCIHCGSRVASDDQQEAKKELLCPVCHAPVEYGDIFCMECGSRLESPHGKKAAPSQEPADRSDRSYSLEDPVIPQDSLADPVDPRDECRDSGILQDDYAEPDHPQGDYTDEKTPQDDYVEPESAQGDYTDERNPQGYYAEPEHPQDNYADENNPQGYYAEPDHSRYDYADDDYADPGIVRDDMAAPGISRDEPSYDDSMYNAADPSVHPVGRHDRRDDFSGYVIDDVEPASYDGASGDDGEETVIINYGIKKDTSYNNIEHIEPDLPRYCVNCGTRMEPDEVFCIRCGTRSTV